METDSVDTPSKQPKIRNNPDEREDEKYEGRGVVSYITWHLNDNYGPYLDEISNCSQHMFDFRSLV